MDVDPVPSGWAAPASELSSQPAIQLQVQRQQQQQQNNRSSYRPRKKLRESCNNCALSKVKCSKEQPVCARCEDRDMYCHYSPTRRTGKRRAWSQTTPVPKTPISPEDAPGYFDYQNLILTHDMMLSHDRNVSSPPIGSVAAISQTAPPHLQIAEKAAGEARSQIHGTMFSENLDPRIFSDSIFGDPSQLGSTVMDHRSDATMATGSYDEQESLLGLMAQDHDFKAISMLGDQYHETTWGGATSDCPVAEQPQHCIVRALDLLQKLHTPPAHCSLAPSSSGESSSWTSSSSLLATRTIDQVLATNKETLVVVHQMLDCPCSLNIQLAFILTTIVSKVICWYSAAAKSSSEPEAAQDGAVGSPSSTTSNATNNANTTTASTSGKSNSNSMGAAATLSTSPPPMVSSPEYVSVHAPVAVGKYNLEGNHKAKMRAQLVLSELHLVLRLVGKLVARFRCIQLGGDSEAGATPLLIFVEMEKFLRDRLQVLAKETTGVLRAV